MKLFYLLIIGIFIYLPGFAQTTITITADRDNTLYQENGSNSNGLGDHFFAGSTNRGDRRRALLHFDLAQVPAGVTITAVTLTLTCNRKASGSTGINIYKLTSNWGEGTSNSTGQEGGGAPATVNDATWTNRFAPSTLWTTAGGDFVNTLSFTSPGNIELGTVTIPGGPLNNLVQDVQSFVTNGATNFGWILTGSNETMSGSAIRFASTNSTTPANRPTLSVTYTSSLPVTLSKFTASVNRGKALLQWQTQTEVNNQYFEVEHSRNGVTFSPLGRVAGRGNTTTLERYEYIHQNIAPGKNYYRLAQYDINGTKKYSQVILLAASGKPAFSLYPNPANNFLYIDAAFLTSNTSYRIINMMGQVAQTGVLFSQQINISKLSPGQYSIVLQPVDGQRLQSTFVKTP